MWVDFTEKLPNLEAIHMTVLFLMGRNINFKDCILNARWEKSLEKRGIPCKGRCDQIYYLVKVNSLVHRTGRFKTF